MSESVVAGLTPASVFLVLLTVSGTVSVMLAALLWRQRRLSRTSRSLADQRLAELEQLRAELQSLSRTVALRDQESDYMRRQVQELSTQNRDQSERLEHWRQQTASLENRVATLSSESDSRQQRIHQIEQERVDHQRRAEVLGQELNEARIALREFEVTLEEERRATSEKLALLERNRDALKQEFENLANRIFEQKSERFSQQTRTSLDTLLNPFRDQLQDFRKRVEDVYTTETKDRQALRSEIKSLQALNQQITEEASNLTRALKGDKKIQGNWGEVILERVLERSGLRKGVEYDTQGTFRDSDGQMLRPDVVVYLPDRRHLVVDSKVSLVAYQRWVSLDDESQRANALREHVDAVRSHIRSLSEKDYSQLSGLHSPDFVFLFMPVEPAFVAAFQQDENLFAEAFERKIIVVTPTTLLATLKTIENIWRYERQSQNARLIADRAGAIYDKLRVFVEAMERMGGQLQTVQGTFDSAMNTLTRGRGNLISQANRFVELGVRVKKELPKAVVEQAEVDADDDPVAGPDAPEPAGDNTGPSSGTSGQE